MFDPLWQLWGVIVFNTLFILNLWLKLYKIRGGVNMIGSVSGCQLSVTASSGVGLSLWLGVISLHLF